VKGGEGWKGWEKSRRKWVEKKKKKIKRKGGRSDLRDVYSVVGYLLGKQVRDISISLGKLERGGGRKLEEEDEATGDWEASNRKAKLSMSWVQDDRGAQERK